MDILGLISSPLVPYVLVVVSVAVLWSAHGNLLLNVVLAVAWACILFGVMKASVSSSLMLDLDQLRESVIENVGFILMLVHAIMVVAPMLRRPARQ